MLNPIRIAFIKAKKENRPALLTYTVAGDSSKKQSLEILKSISDNADILEIGVPHNTPVADGNQIQTSAYRAIKKGIKINDIFRIVKDFKKFNKTKPVILMGYYNMIYQYGENYFLNKCKISGEAEIKFAYSTSGLVSSIRNYSKLDFKLEENFVINTENCRRESTKDNSIRISWTDDDVKNNNFKIKIIGFDKNRNITIIGEHL